MPTPTPPTTPQDVAVSLSPEQQEALTQAQKDIEAERALLLDSLGEALQAKLKDAVEGRLNLGIDQQWQEDGEFYEGIDDANRGEMKTSDAWHTKLPGQVMPGGPSGDVRSTVFVNITRPYCDAAAARIGDMLMPTDDRAFAVKPTPVPELIDLSKGKLSAEVKVAMLNEATAGLRARGDMAAIAGPEHVAPLINQAQQKAQADLEAAKKRAEAAQAQIDDWQVECQYHAEVRKVIEDCAKLGTGVLKGPMPVKRSQQTIVQRDGTYALEIVSEIAPGSHRIDPLNFFPDPACGEDIQRGSYTWERDRLSRRKVEDLRDLPGYLGSQLDKVLAEGPGKAYEDAPEPQGLDKGKREPNIKDLFEIWYFYGIVRKDEIEALGCECDTDSVHAVITMINGRVVKGAINHMDSGEFPYDVMNWQRQAGRWTGIGVSRQIRVPQRMVNAAARNMMDNAGLMAGPQIVLKLRVVTPADGRMEITPRKIWYIDPDAEVQDVKQVFGSINIEPKQEELMAIIQFGLKVAEDVTGLPLLLQGQQGKAPDTLGGMQMLNNNSSTVLRRLAKLFDDCITEPHVRRYYAWIMQYGDDSLKGDFQIDARGSSALVDRELENQNIVQMGSLVLNQAFGINPKKWFEEYCKSKRLDPKRFQYTEEELKELAQQQQQPSDPRVMVAQIRAETETKLQQAEQAFDAQQNERDRQLDQLIAEINNASKENVTLNDLRTRLAAVAIKARAERDRTAVLAHVDLHKHHTPPARAVPPVNPQTPVSTALPQ